MKLGKKMHENVLAVLIAARTLIADRKNWCKNTTAKSAKGKDVWEHDMTACRWCAMGAINFQNAGDARYYAIDSLEHTMDQMKTKELFLAAYNDKHTHQEVIQLFDNTIARLEG